MIRTTGKFVLAFALVVAAASATAQPQTRTAAAPGAQGSTLAKIAAMVCPPCYKP